MTTSGDDGATPGGWLSDEQLAAARQTVPILCVDLVPVRRHPDGAVEVGLVHREMPGRTDPVWCHLGGRVRRGETVRAALLRHLHSTLDGVEADVPADPQPDRVVQWFPTTDEVEPGLVHGYDPRQHAVALVYAVTLAGQPTAGGGEATDFRWWSLAEVSAADDLWPGTEQTVRGALHR